MPRTAERKLSSEERCRKAWEAWWYPNNPPSFRDKEFEAAMISFNAWRAAWDYLESRVEEYVQS